MNGKFVTYYRVSTHLQGINGLGMDAQRAAVATYLNGGRWEVVGEFEEVESGKRSDRPQLAKAMALAKETGAKLLIAKLDRLSRNVHFLSGLREQGVEFVACDMPEANSFTINIMAAVAQQEREQTVARVAASMAVVKANIERDGYHVSKAGRRITKLGGPSTLTDDHRVKAQASIKARTDRDAAKVKPIILRARTAGMTLQQTADELNQAGLKTPRGCLWTPVAVSRVANRD